MAVVARSGVVWVVGLIAYLVAVMHRTSFGVAGLDAADRFGVDPAGLSGFVVLQLLVYASLQVPAGALLDRLGPRTMIAAGAVLMASGQALLAMTGSVPVAIGARVLVGVGDAITFISVLRLVVTWFPARRVPIVTQITAMTGQLGQVLSAVPLLALLHGPGWSTAFGSAAALGVLTAVLALAVLRDRPPAAGPAPLAPSWRSVADGLAAAWRTPGTRLGLWTHLGCQFAGTVFALLWGVPYLVSAQGLTTAQAGVLLTVLVLAGVVAGPVIGELTGRWPHRRSWFALGVIGSSAAVWTIVLVIPAPAPYAVLVVLMVVLGLNGSSSTIGFDFARSTNPPDRLGTAIGIVNVGGFTASVVALFLIGVVLDLLGGYSPEAFRVAWLVQYPIWLFAVVAILRSRTRARAVARELIRS